MREGIAEGDQLGWNREGESDIVSRSRTVRGRDVAAKPSPDTARALEERRLTAEVDGCTLCRTNHRLGIKKVTGIDRGNPSAKIMCVGVAPSPVSASQRRAFAGNSFSRLHGWFWEAGYRGSEDALRQNLYLTSLLKCEARPDTPSHRQHLYLHCQRFLVRQFQFVKPELVLLLGAEPVQIVLQRRELIGESAGRVFMAAQVAEGFLVSPVPITSRWMCMPHPSGMSRVMNDKETRRFVIEALRQDLKRTGLIR